MGRYTDYTRQWLDRRFATTTEGGVYLAHQPIYGLNHPACEPRHQRRLARVCGIAKELATLDFESFLDVGGAEGYLSWLARDLFGATPVSCDLSAEACLRARDLFDLDAAAVASHRLPFDDDAFDVVLCSEVIEHLEYPVQTLLELARVARRALIVTTEEFDRDRAVIERFLFERSGLPHAERNMFHPDDLAALYGGDLCGDAGLRAQHRGTPPAEPVDIDVARRWLLETTMDAPVSKADLGVIATVIFDPSVRRSPALDSEQSVALIDRILAHTTEAKPLVPRDRDPSEALLSRLRCPVTRTPLTREGDALVGGTRPYSIIGGTVPDLADVPDPTRADLEGALDTLSLGAERRDAILALRDSLDLVSDPERDEWRFEEREGRRGWKIYGDLQPETDEAFRFLATGDDPRMLGPGLSRDTASIASVVVRQSIHNPDYPVDAGQVQLFWMFEGDTDLDEAQSLLIPAVNDGEVRDYRFPLQGHPGWPAGKNVLCFRLDPANGPCRVVIESFQIERPA